jgi:hypothetical protein
MTKGHAAYAIVLKLIEAKQALLIEVLGEDLSKKNKWKLDGDEAVYLYLAKKYGWTLEHCRGLSFENLALALSEELEAAPWPKHLQSVFDALKLTEDALKKIGDQQS